ncbi:MAG: hypothetical protein ACYC63_02990 [Armatimonadota bacterium]
MVRFVLAMVVLASVAGPLPAQDDGKPWEAWEPPVVTLPQPNGFDTYLQAFDLKKRIDEQFPPNQPPAEGQPPDRWGEGPADLPLPDRVALYADVLKLVRVALTQETRIPPPAGASELMPYLASFRAIARVLAMEAEVHRIDGDHLGAAGSALNGLMVAQAASSQRTLISYMVGTACEAYAIRSLDETIPNLKAAELRQVLARLLQIESTCLPIQETLDSEESFGRMCFQTMMKASAQQQRQMAAELGLAPPELKTMVESMNLQSWQAIGEMYNLLRGVAKMPYPRRPRPIPLPKDPFAEIIMPVGDKVLFKHAQSLTELHLREAELASRAYLLEKKQVPPDLQTLVPDYLPQVPSDPFGEGPLRSAVVNEKLVIYSIGPDMKDDGGKPLDTPFPQMKSTGDVGVAVSAGL